MLKQLIQSASSFMSPYLLYIKIGAAVAALIAAFSFGVRWESNSREAELVDVMKAMQQQYKDEVAAGNKRAAKLIAANQKAKNELRNLRARIDNEASTYKPAPDAALAAVPAWVVTTDHVGVWNDSLCQGITDGECGAYKTPGTAGFAQGTTLTRKDLLQNHADNTSICNDIRRQLNSLIDVLEARNEAQ